ncbi:MAG: 1-aminocyclopropane-carboxylate deaminase [Bacteroidota bacterium]|nr:1-aminocyclopropane-carboxylate deaminase [Bacteroidota bacterium]
MNEFLLPSPLQQIENELTRKFNIHLFIKRDDLIHPQISGNKWRKLKYNIEQARKENKNTMLTFGGAYSNHITAVAAAGKLLGFITVGIIRGEEHAPLNKSLQFAKDCGMKLLYVDRETYRNKNYELQFTNYDLNKDDIYLLPEGGANELGVKGCKEIVDEIYIDFDFICSACGTGTTLAGIVQNLKPHQTAVGIAILKHETLANEIVSKFGIQHSSFNIQHYPFGGYAKTTPELIKFIKDFYDEQQIMLDYVYTGKMMYGIYDLISKNYFPENSTVVVVHTGGVVNANVNL